MRMPERMLYRVMDLAHFTAVRTSARSECEQVLEHVVLVDVSPPPVAKVHIILDGSPYLSLLASVASQWCDGSRWVVSHSGE